MNYEKSLQADLQKLQLIVKKYPALLETFDAETKKMLQEAQQLARGMNTAKPLAVAMTSPQEEEDYLMNSKEFIKDAKAYIEDLRQKLDIFREENRNKMGWVVNPIKWNIYFPNNSIYPMAGDMLNLFNVSSQKVVRLDVFCDSIDRALSIFVQPIYLSEHFEINKKVYKKISFSDIGLPNSQIILDKLKNNLSKELNILALDAAIDFQKALNRFCDESAEELRIAVASLNSDYVGDLGKIRGNAIALFKPISNNPFIDDYSAKLNVKIQSAAPFSKEKFEEVFIDSVSCLSVKEAMDQKILAGLQSKSEEEVVAKFERWTADLQKIQLTGIFNNTANPAAQKQIQDEKEAQNLAFPELFSVNYPNINEKVELQVKTGNLDTLDLTLDITFSPKSFTKNINNGERDLDGKIVKGYAIASVSISSPGPSLLFQSDIKAEIYEGLGQLKDATDPRQSNVLTNPQAGNTKLNQNKTFTLQNDFSISIKGFSYSYMLAKSDSSTKTRNYGIDVGPINGGGSEDSNTGTEETRSVSGAGYFVLSGQIKTEMVVNTGEHKIVKVDANLEFVHLSPLQGDLKYSIDKDKKLQPDPKGTIKPAIFFKSGQAKKFAKGIYKRN